MTELQLISHMEQMEAHRTAFLIEWSALEWELRDEGYDNRRLTELQITLWNKYRRDHGLLKPTTT